MVRRSQPIGCPRDKSLLRAATLGDAVVDVCGKCFGTFFESGALFAAAGIPADPASWDRPETGAAVKEGNLRCPRCEQTVMGVQDVSHGADHVEIDRCGKCQGIWLDKDELDTLVAIGHAMRPLLDAEREKARDELARMGEPDLDPVITPRRLKIGALVAVALSVAGYVAYDKYESAQAARRAAERQNRPQNQEGGCPCGCDRSQAMAAELRERGGSEAPRAIDETLSTIAEREAVGYITERMIVHRLRMLEVAKELGHDARHGATTKERCTMSRVEGGDLRVCADFVVHGERYEVVRGSKKLVTSSFRLWLEIENLSGEERRLDKVSIEAGRFHLPISRWYEEGTAGEPWEGTLRGRAKIRVNVIGYFEEPVKPGTAIDAAIALGPVTTRVRTAALADIHFD